MALVISGRRLSVYLGLRSVTICQFAVAKRSLCYVDGSGCGVKVIVSMYCLRVRMGFVRACWRA